jgi:hypothetical protein
VTLAVALTTMAAAGLALAPAHAQDGDPVAAEAELVAAGSVEAVAEIAAPPPPVDPAAGFDPGHIISDSMMTSAHTMTAEQVNQFIAEKGADCVPGPDRVCLRDYREATPTWDPTEFCPGGYQGAESETAGDVIARVGQSCNINPQVLLVTLEKEQGLITSTDGKTPHTYSRALGFGCPDNVGGVCYGQFSGFANQVWSAAAQLNRYAQQPESFRYRAGVVNDVQFNPDAACGSAPVHIANQATASLYNYTPYQPNASAIEAGFGEGDACSAYGNRNFSSFFQTWFGPATAEAPAPQGGEPVPEAERPVLQLGRDVFAAWVTPAQEVPENPAEAEVDG